jgi:hypothetical protein
MALKTLPADLARAIHTPHVCNESDHRALPLM